YYIGDGVIIPAPYYSFFEIDIGLRAKVKRYKAFCTKVDDIEIESLEDAYQNAVKENVKVKALLITSPNNPTGVCFSKKTLENVLKWAQKKQIHCIVDEVY